MEGSPWSPSSGRQPLRGGHRAGGRRCIERKPILNRYYYCLPGTMEASPGVEHHRREVRAHPPTQVGTFPALLLPLIIQEGCGAASQGSAIGRVRVDNGQVHRLPSHAFCRISVGRRPFLAMSTPRLCGTRAWVMTKQ